MPADLLPQLIANVRAAIDPKTWDTVLTAVVGPLFSTAVGAVVVQWAINRSQSRKAFQEEWNAISSALSVAFLITNRSLSLKGQVVKPLRDKFVREKQSAELWLQDGTRPFEVNCDLQTVPNLNLPIYVFERNVFERISLRGRALFAAIETVSAVKGLDQAIANRLSIVESFKSIPESEKPRRYLGLPDKDMIIDQSFESNVLDLYGKTDDCIFYSRLFAEDLTKYARDRLRRVPAYMKAGLRELSSADWTKGEAAGLFPPQSEYQSWLSGYVERPSWRQRQLAKAKLWILSRIN